MAEDKNLEATENTEESSEQEEGAEPKKKKANVLVIAIMSIAVIATAVLAYFFLFASNSEESKEEVVVVQPSVFFEIPEIIVSLSGNTSNIRYLKLVLSFEIASAEDQAVIESLLPKVTDEFQTYLRQLRLQDLKDTYRLKESLLLRINQVVQPVEVKDVLIQEMLVQ